MKKQRYFGVGTVSTALLLILIAGCNGEQPETLIASSKSFLAQHDNKAAIIQLKNALQINPNLGEARFLLGNALLESGDPIGAIVEFRKALELKYSVEETKLLLARALLSSGQAKKVIDEFASTDLSAGTPTANIKTLLSLAYQAQGNREASKAALEKALLAQSDYAPALLADARQRALNRNLPGALSLVNAVLEKSPNDPDALMLKGSIVAAQGEADESLEFYRKAVEAKPDFIIAHAAVVSTLLQQGKVEEAGKQVGGLKKIAPNHPQTIFLEALLAAQRTDYKSARALSQQLLKISPNNPNYLQIAGSIEYHLGSFVQAESYLTKALQQSPGLRIARRLLVANYLRTGQAAKAMAVIAPALETIDRDPALLALAGQTFLLNNNAKKAEEYFLKANRLDPNNPGKRTSLALTHLAQGDIDTGFEELEQISNSDKGTIADLAMISVHLRSNNFDKALKAIDNLQKKQPDSPNTYNLRGQTLLAKKDSLGARKSFEKALSINPAFLPSALSLANLDLSEKKPEDAFKRLEAILAVDPKSIGALLALADLKNATGAKPEQILSYITKAVDGNPSEVAPRLAQIDFHLRNKDTKKALTSAQNALAAIPDKPELLNALGRTQQLTGDFNQALVTYGKLAGLQTASPIAHMRMAEIYVANKNNDEATKNLRKALEITPDLLDAQRALIRLLLDGNKVNEALTITKKIQQQHPREAVGYLLEGDVHASSKKWPDALSAYKAGLKQTPAPELAIKIHSALSASENSGEAEKYAANWISEHPKDVAFRLYLGDIAISRKDFQRAAQSYRNALDIQPNNSLALNNLAWVSGQLKLPKALEYANKANELSPNQPQFMDTQAMLLADKGETAKAIEILRKAVAITPQATGIQLNLAKVLISAGRKDDARKELDLLAKLGDKFPNQAEVARLQKEL